MPTRISCCRLCPPPGRRTPSIIVPALWSIFWSHPILHIAATLGPFWIYGATRLFTNPLRAALFALALALAVMSYDFTRIFVIVSTPMLLQITREVVADNARDGGGSPRSVPHRRVRAVADHVSSVSVRRRPASFRAGRSRRATRMTAAAREWLAAHLPWIVVGLLGLWLPPAVYAVAVYRGWSDPVTIATVAELALHVRGAAGTVS